MVTSLRFYAAKILYYSLSYITFSTRQHWHHLPCDQWVHVHTDCLGLLILQSVKTAFVKHNIPH